MSEWKPIETAPKPDCLGPYIIVAKRGQRCGRVCDLAFWEDEPREGDEAGWRSATNHDGYEYAGLDPTHWMPLPEPPK